MLIIGWMDGMTFSYRKVSQSDGWMISGLRRTWKKRLVLEERLGKERSSFFIS